MGGGSGVQRGGHRALRFPDSSGGGGSTCRTHPVSNEAMPRLLLGVRAASDYRLGWKHCLRSVRGIFLL